MRGGLEGVRVLARLDQHIDLDVLPADLLDQIRQRRNAGKHRQPAIGRADPSVAERATEAADTKAATNLLAMHSRRIGSTLLSALRFRAGLAHQMHGMAILTLGQGVVLGELDPMLPLVGRQNAAALCTAGRCYRGAERIAARMNSDLLGMPFIASRRGSSALKVTISCFLLRSCSSVTPSLG